MPATSRLGTSPLGSALAQLLVNQQTVQGQPVPAPTFRTDDPFATLAGFGNTLSADAAKSRSIGTGQLLLQRLGEGLAAGQQAGGQLDADGIKAMANLIQSTGEFPELATIVAQAAGLGRGSPLLAEGLQRLIQRGQATTAETAGSAIENLASGGFTPDTLAASALTGLPLSPSLPTSVAAARERGPDATTTTKTVVPGRGIVTVRERGVNARTDSSGGGGDGEDSQQSQIINGLNSGQLTLQARRVRSADGQERTVIMVVPANAQ